MTTGYQTTIALALMLGAGACGPKATTLPTRRFDPATAPSISSIEPLPACSDPFADATESVIDTIVVEVEAGYELRDIPGEVLQQLATGLASAIELPSPLPMPPVLRQNADWLNGVQGFAGEAFIAIDKTGARPPKIGQSTLSPTLDSALLWASARMVADPPIALLKAAKGKKQPALFARLRTAGVAEPPPKVESIEPALLPVARVPLAPVRIRKIALSRVAAAARELRPPRFPMDMQYVYGRGGKATYEFVIGPDGRVVPGTLRIVSATNTSFAYASYRAFDDARFIPAAKTDCALATLVAQPFIFTMEPPH